MLLQRGFMKGFLDVARPRGNALQVREQHRPCTHAQYRAATEEALGHPATVQASLLQSCLITVPNTAWPVSTNLASRDGKN